MASCLCHSQASINLFEWRVIAVYTSRLWAHVLRPATISAVALTGASAAAVVCVSWLSGYTALLALTAQLRQGIVAFASMSYEGGAEGALLPTVLLVPGAQGTASDVNDVSGCLVLMRSS
jgi:hypothetical protein